MEQWNADDDYETRINALNSGSVALIQNETVFDDGQADWLLGGRDQDWWFDGEGDRLLAVRSNEVVD